MPGILTASTETYKFDLEAMKLLIAADLNLKPEHIDVRYNIENISNHPMDDGYPTVTGVTVVVDKNHKGSKS